MADLFTLYSGEDQKPSPVDASPTKPTRVFVSKGGPVSYAAAPDFDADSLGQLAQGESLTTKERLWLRAAGSNAQLIVGPPDA